ncbi:hypothetical protein L596_009027 [Steinernema carpocapsae]|uniref:Uncharacterized protein n=1 Tax=Steinernema carpocapsae TaxID=34508 RepID=A0A4U5PFC9_STECR|nr:hypothetical protein L596_009027 [Steinernema carpocapsae]
MLTPPDSPVGPSQFSELRKAVQDLEHYESFVSAPTDPNEIEDQLRETIHVLQQKLWAAKETSKRYEGENRMLRKLIQQLKHNNKRLEKELKEANKRIEYKDAEITWMEIENEHFESQLTPGPKDQKAPETPDYQELEKDFLRANLLTSTPVKNRQSRLHRGKMSTPQCSPIARSLLQRNMETTADESEELRDEPTFIIQKPVDKSVESEQPKSNEDINTSVSSSMSEPQNGQFEDDKKDQSDHLESACMKEGKVESAFSELSSDFDKHVTKRGKSRLRKLKKLSNSLQKLFE